MGTPSQNQVGGQTPQQYPSLLHALEDGVTHDVLHNGVQQPTPSSVSRTFEDASLLLGLNTNGGLSMPNLPPFGALHDEYQAPSFGPASMAFPDFFEQVMMPGVEMSHHPSLMPPDVSNFTSDLDFNVGDFDFSFLASGLTRPPTAQGFPEYNHGSIGTVETQQSDLLEDLIDVFLLQDSSAIDSYIHSATFASDKICTELLLAVVAAGARFVALAPVWQMGLVIQEVVRIAIGELLEHDNKATRDLQPLQVILLVLDIGVWSGFRRKTEIAMSFLQPPVTMLAWSNAFMKFSYRDVVPLLDDADDVLMDKWRAWTEREAKKRLILHTFLHDSQLALLYAKNPLISPAQLMMPLPACRELWLAPNAHAWQNAYIRLAPPSQADTPAMMEFFGHNAVLNQSVGVYDNTLCMLIACHGLGHEIWQYRAHARLLSGWKNTTFRRDRRSDHMRLQRDLLDDLTTMLAHCDLQSTSAPEMMLTLQLLMMLLHVDIEDVQTFSGKLGEEEARRVFPKIMQWSQNAESRVAVFHAGQIFRVARTFEKTRLRDFYAVALYHAALTLWVYGMITTSAARKSGRQSPSAMTPRLSNTSHQSAALPARIPLDTADDRAARSFQLLGQGTPGVYNLQSEFVPLPSSRGLMNTAASILKANFPQSTNGLPPLIDNLANLMGEIGKLSGHD
ncbi:hypothetical protein B0A54_05467 [Friedmanniomyces endolithicus]|uniref:Xylanolytic transcriptional activator regulatory domain-containing protein n=1 Tax=Friedmanniomyces endolithicus TaxID=329885 RepID=A0A4U0V4V5_9PEZI|nr:hypothetical protein B0A54_05467 [Friedmanniomyces endolithicus]